MKRTKFAVTLALAIVLGLASFAWAASKVVTIGACQPITGRFSFAGKHIHEGLRDYIDWANKNKAVRGGYTLKYVFEDTTYKVNVAVTAFKRIMAKYNPQFMYGESTGQGKAVYNEVKNRYKVIYGSTSFSAYLANPMRNPYTFVSGPTYQDMMGILLKYIAMQAKKTGKKKVGFMYSNTEFGRDPIPYAKRVAKKLGLKVVFEASTAVGAVNIRSHMIRMAAAKPDFVLFQGYVLSPVPQVIKAARARGLKTVFMATFWGMGQMVLKKLGPLAEGYMGVMFYPYWYEKGGATLAAIKKYNLAKGIKYRPSYYMQGWFTGMVFVRILNGAIKMGKGKLKTANLVKALARIKNWNTGGMMGVVSIRRNKFAQGRVYRADVKKAQFVPVSGYIKVR
ncbi:MAG: ABC transporter substrate-binding protein [Proteobacteria bacterium]|nr:ABC transporter substrate-binding protein [Pseudomonadota bacterium]